MPFLIFLQSFLFLRQILGVELLIFAIIAAEKLTFEIIDPETKKL